ncbi:MAG: hypothetical protein HY056_07575 [Proteobacteria bacterium]|nr:hypothetical protein [Pseudomonadota bacterium]
MLVVACKPAELTDAERASFIELVRAGGEVGGQVLEKNIAYAQALVFLRQEGQVMLRSEHSVSCPEINGAM